MHFRMYSKSCQVDRIDGIDGATKVRPALTRSSKPIFRVWRVHLQKARSASTCVIKTSQSQASMHKTSEHKVAFRIAFYCISKVRTFTQCPAFCNLGPS